MNIRKFAGWVRKVVSKLLSKVCGRRTSSRSASVSPVVPSCDMAASPVAVAPVVVSQYAVGQTVTGVVRIVNQTGVHLKVFGAGDVMVTARSLRKVFGTLFDRRVRVGMAFRAVVKALYPATKQLVADADPAMAEADLPALPRATRKTPVKKASKPSVKKAAAQPSKKPRYAVLPKGTTVLVDLANVFSSVANVCRLTKADAAMRFAVIARSVSAGLVAQGYRALLLVEQRTLVWCGRTLDEASCGMREALDGLEESGEVSVVYNQEADLVLLQNANALANSVILSNDRFLDYADTYGGIVGTSRVRRFTCVNDGQWCRLSVDGLADVVSVDLTVAKGMSEAKETADESVALRAPEGSAEGVGKTPVAADAETLERTAARLGENRKPGLLGASETLWRQGHSAAAMACLEKEARKGSATAYRKMSELCARSGGDKAMAAKARRYERLSERLEKRYRQEERRAARQAAERKRNSCVWLNAA